MHIVVFGAAAFREYFGAHLAQAGEKGTFIARGEHLQSMLVNGLLVSVGDFTFKPIIATDNTTKVKAVDTHLHPENARVRTRMVEIG